VHRAIVDLPAASAGVNAIAANSLAFILPLWRLHYPKTGMLAEGKSEKEKGKREKYTQGSLLLSFAFCLLP
jgi:hypothetical protein